MNIAIMLFVMAFMAVCSIYLYSTRNKPSYTCILHKDFYKAGLLQGRVIKKHIDKANHATKTVIIKQQDRIFEINMVPESNAIDFEKLSVGDEIMKQPNSFNLIVNNTYQFQLHIDCDFNVGS